MRAAGRDGENLVVFTYARRGNRLQPADSLDPSVAGQHDVRVFANDIGLFVEFRRLFLVRNPRLTLVGVLLGELAQFLAHLAPKGRLGTEQLFDPLRLATLFAKLFQDLFDFELADAIEVEVPDGEALVVVQLERPAESLGR